MILPEQLAGKSEKSQQVALFAQAALHVHKYPQLKWLFAIPNANSHKMVSEGVRAGVPDIFLPCEKRYYTDECYHGLFIELKIESRRKEKNGGCSDDQINYIAYLNKAGYKAVVCYGWEHAWKTILNYLDS